MRADPTERSTNAMARKMGHSATAYPPEPKAVAPRAPLDAAGWVELEAKMQITQHMMRRFSALRSRIWSYQKALGRIEELNKAIAGNTDRSKYVSRCLREHKPPSLTVTDKGPKTPLTAPTDTNVPLPPR